MARKILCVAEKPAIARAVATHLSGGAFQTHAIRGNQYVKNYEFDFNFGGAWGNCSVTMTSVVGHLTGLDFDRQYKGWMSCPPGSLFEAPVQEFVDKDKLPIADNIRNQAKYSKALFIWTDCDREESAHVRRAALAPVNLDEYQASAVAARIELDLRIGAAFTRLQTLQLQTVVAALKEKVISYGSCQFPTLGFVVDRYLRVQNFKPETFWGIKVILSREGKKVNFLWKRVHLFDRAVVTMMLERCLVAKQAKVTKVSQKPTSKWRPLPLTTVDLQMMGSRFLRLDSQTIMKVAEALYTKGFISYPRTETDQFDKAIDLKKLIEKQYPDSSWGQYARELVDGKFRTPRFGRHNDKAHPPIHPVSWVSPNQLNANEKKVYEFVVRRFLACCSDDAKGQGTEIEIQYGEESFHTNGLIVLERNYLDVYVYDKWESSQQIPNFERGELFEPTEANIFEGKTTAPNYLTEPELIGLMDANGIGTDATMAEHIAKIKEREYVAINQRGSGRSAVQEFIPTRLGIALVEGYDNVVEGLPNSVSLSKPFLRKEMELRMIEICSGTKTRQEVVQQSLDMYREVFIHTQRRINMLKNACRKYLVEETTS
ncbi:DNA topoisomerase, type IA, domain 2 [Penicillium digitatum]|uniref:DNA topoisomerase n=1 Tax=Penicillium digitatum TaxID=36651 RepID=A0A7T6XHX8_PENDI|nr:DNA topoisomerase, type IA, domain 2 [Penicillium digitatum]